jgi:putative peptidoglycan lipid II flippase
VLRLRRQWIADQRLLARSLRMAGATIGMGAVLWLALRLFTPQLAHADLAGAAALLAVCSVGASVYGLLGAALGVVRLSELRFMMRRPAGVTAADPGEPQ